ncbi:tetratricopeptide repeat protein [Albimonas pacifica]|uniref:Uncharacterized protein n=1 Tax=Albimonas pacifica TaxID=1114924 RepID=A0A1I3DVN6_9RHOB|nr:tetratricopeptide repeat protein [Albimonas pacifica]SFH90790.1 hypothetical protein SAMN05216258_10340 [Albimonas pacifica]
MRWIAVLPAAALCAAAQAAPLFAQTAPQAAPPPLERPAGPGAASGAGIEALPRPGAGGFDGAPLTLPTGPAPETEAAARAAESARCQALVDQDPVAAREVAREWGRQGGGVPAAVCEALALEAQGALATAAARLEDAARRAPEQALPAPARAALYEVAAGFRLRDLQPAEALAAADAGLALDGAGPVLRRLRAEALAALGRGDEALPELDAALEAMPWDLPGLRLRARLRGEAGDAAGALADAGRVSAMADDDPEAWLALGEAQAAAGRPERARESFLRAVARDREGPVGDRARRALQLLDAPGAAPVAPPPAATGAPAGEADPAAASAQTPGPSGPDAAGPAAPGTAPPEAAAPEPAADAATEAAPEAVPQAGQPQADVPDAPSADEAEVDGRPTDEALGGTAPAPQE